MARMTPWRKRRTLCLRNIGADLVPHVSTVIQNTVSTGSNVIGGPVSRCARDRNDMAGPGVPQGCVSVYCGRELGLSREGVAAVGVCLLESLPCLT